MLPKDAPEDLQPALLHLEALGNKSVGPLRDADHERPGLRCVLGARIDDLVDVGQRKLALARYPELAIVDKLQFSV